MGAGGAAASGSDAGFENKKKSKVSTLTKLKLKAKPVIATVISGFTNSEEVNRKFYEEKVVPAGKSKAPDYETYMKDRLAGKTDAYGNPTPNQGGNDNNNQPAQETIVKKNIGGTEVQTTEAKLAEEKEEAEEYDTRKTKKKGRRQTILTSQTGASGNLVLGKPSLLGA